MSLSPDGKLLWERSLAEEFGMWTTHGGRMSSPIIDGDQVIVSGLDVHVGQHRRRRAPLHVVRQDDGQDQLVSAPEGRPTDTIYANPFIADVNGVAARSSRAAATARCTRSRSATGETGLELARQPARAQHRRARASATTSSSPTARRTSARARWACWRRSRRRPRATLTDKDARWITRGVQAGYASPVTDGERIYLARQRRRAVRVRR